MARTKWSARQMLEQVREVAAQIGPGVTLREFLDRTSVPESQIRREFGTWESLRRKAGLSPEDRDHRRLSDEQLWEEFTRVFKLLRQVPTAGELQRLGRYSARTYYVRFGTQRQIRRAFSNWLKQQFEVLKAEADKRGITLPQEVESEIAKPTPARPARRPGIGEREQREHAAGRHGVALTGQ